MEASSYVKSGNKMQESLASIRLPKDRIKQLREFCDTMGGKTLSAGLGELLKFARNQGIIRHTIPSVQLNAFPDGVALTIEDNKSQGFSHAEVVQIATQIRQCVEKRNGGDKTGFLSETQGGTALIYGRGGQTVAVCIPMNTEPKMFTLDLASDLADLLEETARKEHND